jgi:hypothetical protein
LHYESLAETARCLKDRAISPVELARHQLDRIAPSIHGFTPSSR